MMNCIGRDTDLSQGQLLLSLQLAPATVIDGHQLTVTVSDAKNFNVGGRSCQTTVEVQLCPLYNDKKQSLDLLYSTVHSAYQAVFNISIPASFKSKRLILSVWIKENDRHQRCSHLLGCLSFGLHHLLQKCERIGRHTISGWYHLLPDELGHRKHILANQIVHKMANTSRDGSEPDKENSVEGTFKFQLNYRTPGYGFNVQDVQPVQIGQIMTGSIAAEAGLQKRDRIIKINGITVDTWSYSEVAKLIRSCKQSCTLEIIRPDRPTLNTNNINPVDLSPIPSSPVPLPLRSVHKTDIVAGQPVMVLYDDDNDERSTQASDSAVFSSNSRKRHFLRYDHSLNTAVLSSQTSNGVHTVSSASDESTKFTQCTEDGSHVCDGCEHYKAKKIKLWSEDTVDWTSQCTQSHGHHYGSTDSTYELGELSSLKMSPLSNSELSSLKSFSISSGHYTGSTDRITSVLDLSSFSSEQSNITTSSTEQHHEEGRDSVFNKQCQLSDKALLEAVKQGEERGCIIYSTGIENLVKPFRSIKVLSTKQCRKLFQNIEKLLAISRFIVPLLGANVDGLKKAYTDNISIVESSYQHYVQGLAEALELLEKLKTCPTMKQSFADHQRLDELYEFLWAPVHHLKSQVQRIEQLAEQLGNNLELKKIAQTLESLISKVNVTYSSPKKQKISDALEENSCLEAHQKLNAEVLKKGFETIV